MKSEPTRTYGYKLLERGTLKEVAKGFRKAWSKLNLKDQLAQENPRIPVKNIIVWDHAKDAEPMTTSKPKHAEFGFHARLDGSNWRVWPTGRGWFGDQFEILSTTEFDQLNAMMARFGIEIKVLGDDEESGDESCHTENVQNVE